MRTSNLDFSGARNIINPEAELAKTFGQTSSTLDKMIAQSAEKRRAEEALKQQALQNQIAREGLNLRQAAGQREADKYARDVAGDDALRTYTQQLGNYGSDVVPEADAMEILKAYEADPSIDVQAKVDAAQNRYNADTIEGAQSRVDILNRVAMPSGDYDPARLITMQENAVAKPQGTLDSIVAAKAAEEKRIQANKDKEALAWQKEQWLRSRPKEETGTISMSIGTPGTADYRETNVPVSKMEPLQKAGWTIGKADLAGSGSGRGSSSKNASKRTEAFTKFHETVSDYGVNTLGFSVSDDVKTSKDLLNKMEAIGADENTVARILAHINAKGGDRELGIKELNEYGGVVYDPKTGKSLKYGDAINKAFEEDLVLTVDDKGLPTLAPKYVDDTPKTEQELQKLIEERGKKEEQAEIPKSTAAPKNILDLLGFERPQRQRSVIQEDIDPETGFYRNQALEDTSLDFIGAGFANKVRKIQAAKNMSKAAKEAAIEKVRKQFAKAGNQVEGIVGSPTYLRKQGTAAARDLKDEIAKATARRKEVVSSGATAPVKPGYPYSNITKKLDKTDDALLEKLLKEKDMLEKELKQFR